MAIDTDKIKRQLDQRKKELEAFDKLPKAEQERRTKIGLNPHEPLKVRRKKKLAEEERRKREFDKMPLEKRTLFESLGLSPYQKGQVIRRETGTIKTVK